MPRAHRPCSTSFRPGSATRRPFWRPRMIRSATLRRSSAMTIPCTSAAFSAEQKGSPPPVTERSTGRNIWRRSNCQGDGSFDTFSGDGSSAGFSGVSEGWVFCQLFQGIGSGSPVSFCPDCCQRNRPPDTFKSLMTKFPEECKTYNIAEIIQFAEEALE